MKQPDQHVEREAYAPNVSELVCQRDVCLPLRTTQLNYRYSELLLSAQSAVITRHFVMVSYVLRYVLEHNAHVQSWANVAGIMIQMVIRYTIKVLEIKVKKIRDNLLNAKAYLNETVHGSVWVTL